MPKYTTETLFDLTEEMKALTDDLEAWAEDHEGDVTDYPMERLDKLEGEVKDKVLKCAALYKEWRAQGEAIREEEKAMAKRRQAHDNRGARLKAYMESCLPPNAKFEGPRASVSWKKNPPSVEVLVDVDQLPAKYKRITVEVDKSALKADMTEFEVPVVDSLGQPAFDTDGKPLVEKQFQVRWPKILPEGEDLFAEKEPDMVLARLKAGRSLVIK